MADLVKYLPPFVTVEKDKPQIIALCPRERIREAVEYMIKQNFRFVTMTGYDDGTNLVVLYHFAFHPGQNVPERGVIHLKVVVSKEDPKIPTVSDILPPAFLYEREIWEFLGVIFEGHPRLEHLFLTEDYPKYPLRKS